jgi:hypothetical protein
VTWTTIPGVVPQVTIGEMEPASISTSVSKVAPASLGSALQRSMAASK